MIPLPLIAGAAAIAAGGLALFSRGAARRAERLVPMDGEIIEVEGNRLHYVDKGSGPALVMIHGLGGQMRNFARPLVDDLARDHRVVLVDRPGSGYSLRGAGASASLSAQAAAIAGLIRALGLERPMLVGHSLGGAVSLTLALEQPDCVGSLALIAPLTQDESDAPDVFKSLEIRSPLVRRLIANSIAVPMAMAMREKAMKMVFGPEPVPADFGTEGGGLLGARPGNFYETSSDLVALENQMPALVARYGEIAVPASILYGDGDRLLDPERHGRITAGQIDGARLEIVPGGHMLPFTQPELTARWLREAEAQALDEDA
ncbi:alpha/beta fold hydrolase [Sphingosinicella terrae]|uniref:alpha/beta fold hydrolase n=1 Tax=Sphingosinicella terrae TaxID=2172047 RepID=UPI00254964AF|nr:alpha/beta hydrolase [Sphingosinicella terrae]